MHKLEKLQESLKEVLLVSEDSVEQKIQELEESYKAKKSKCETEVAKLQVKLDESAQKAKEMKRALSKYKAADLLESKVKDLPAYEAGRVKRALSESTSAEIEAKFDGVLRSVRKHIDEAKIDTEQTVESEIKKILDSEDVAEDDMLKNRAHNAHIVAEKEDDVVEDDMLKNRPHNAHVVAEDEEDNFETMDDVKIDEYGEVQLDESDVIDRDLMRRWCDRSMVID